MDCLNKVGLKKIISAYSVCSRFRLVTDIILVMIFVVTRAQEGQKKQTLNGGRVPNFLLLDEISFIFFRF